MITTVKNGTLEKLEFEEFISKLGIFLARQELTTVYNAFDLNKDGNIQYEEFISLLRVNNNNYSESHNIPIHTLQWPDLYWLD